MENHAIFSCEAHLGVSPFTKSVKAIFNNQMKWSEAKRTSLIDFYFENKELLIGHDPTNLKSKIIKFPWKITPNTFTWDTEPIYFG